MQHPLSNTDLMWMAIGYRHPELAVGLLKVFAVVFVVPMMLFITIAGALEKSPVKTTMPAAEFCGDYSPYFDASGNVTCTHPMWDGDMPADRRVPNDHPVPVLRSEDGRVAPIYK